MRAREAKSLRPRAGVRLLATPALAAAYNPTPMKTWIALFRGINVMGNNKLPMKDLATLLRGLAFREVRTYIQSGNAVFASRGAPHPSPRASRPRSHDSLGSIRTWCSLRRASFVRPWR